MMANRVVYGIIVLHVIALSFGVGYLFGAGAL